MKQNIKRFIKWIGVGLLSLAGLVLLALGLVYPLSNARLNKTYDIQPSAVSIPTGETAVAEGERLFVTRGCIDCHGVDGSGKVIMDAPLVGTVSGSNLTTGEGGVGQLYSDSDWARAIRHGIGPDGKPLLVMPSQEFNAMNDNDLGMMIAYLKSLPPVDHLLAPNAAGPLGRILLVTNLAPILPVEQIDHTAPRAAVEPGATVAYGQYLAQNCIGCHGVGLSGGPLPGLPAEPPLPRNLTPDVETGLGTWTETDFFVAMREGKRPDGSPLAPDKMPWPNFKQMTDEELTALWLYLQSIPPQPYGNR